jgi:CHAD domain-containing protein
VAGDDEGVHQARVASRRLREAVPVLAAGLKRGGKAQRKIRRVTKALGTVREMDVTMQILDELAQRPGIPRNALEDVRAHVLSERDRRRVLMLSRLKAIDTRKLSRRLEEVAQDLRMATAPEWREILGARIGRRSKRFAAAIQAAGQMYAPDRLHAVRIAGKKLRYTLELAADARVRAARALVAVLKDAQETLGRLNDLHVIQGHVAQVQAHPPERRDAADGDLDLIGRTLEEECRHLHARYVSQAPALLDLAETGCSKVLAELAALGRRRAIKMVRPRVVRPSAAKGA